MLDVTNLRQQEYRELIEKVFTIVHENNLAVYDLGDLKICGDMGYADSKKGNAHIVLAEDTAVELGAPQKDSISMAMWTSRRGTLSDRLWTSGSDFPGLVGASVPFLQIIMLEFDNGSQAVESDIGRIKNLTNRIPGFMTRSMGGKTWIRIDKKLIRKGFSLYALGQCLYKAYTDAIPAIKSMEIILMTDNDALMHAFQPLAEAAHVIAGDNNKFKWIADGVVSCDELNCDRCEEKPACDTIKEILTKRRANG